MLPSPRLGLQSEDKFTSETPHGGGPPDLNIS
jgi:hypothetical protein